MEVSAQDAIHQIITLAANSNLKLPSALQNFAENLMDDPEQIRVLTRMQVPEVQPPEESSIDTISIMIIDTETTGLNVQTDQLIEIGYALVTVDCHTQQLKAVTKYVEMLQEPKEPLTEVIKQLTGLTDELLQGHHFDTTQLQEDVSASHIILAHNASFDRKFLEAEFEFFKDSNWLCTYKDVDWVSRGTASLKLVYLAYESNFFFDAHRALTDVYALINVIKREKLMPELLTSFDNMSYLLAAPNAPFDDKDTLKNELGFYASYQNGKFKSWFKITQIDDLQDTLSGLKDQTGIKNIELHVIPRNVMYSTRTEELITGTCNMSLEQTLEYSKEPTLLNAAINAPTLNTLCKSAKTPIPRKSL